MIRKSISNWVNNSVSAIMGDTSLPDGRKAGETPCPSSPQPTTSVQPSSGSRMDPLIQAGKGILQTVSQQFKRKSCLWFATLDLHCLGTRFKLPDHPSSMDLTSKKYLRAWEEGLVLNPCYREEKGGRGRLQLVVCSEKPGRSCHHTNIIPLPCKSTPSMQE